MQGVAGDDRDVLARGREQVGIGIAADHLAGRLRGEDAAQLAGPTAHVQNPVVGVEGQRLERARESATSPRGSG